MTYDHQGQDGKSVIGSSQVTAKNLDTGGGNGAKGAAT